MKIQERIKNISNYFVGMEINSGFYLVKVKYGKKWGAYDRQDGLIKKAQSEEEADVWFYYADIEQVELDEVFDLIEETIQMNQSALAKVELLRAKIEELKTLFEENTLETLETLEFTFTEPKKKKARKVSKKKKEANTEPKNTEKQEVEDNVTIVATEEVNVEENNG